MSANPESTSSDSDGEAPVEIPATLALFGYPDSTAKVNAISRSTAWRAIRASAFLGGGLLLAIILGMVPPHAPWVAMALGAGFYFGHRKWRERWTIVWFEGLCPKCGGQLRIPDGTPLRPVLSVPCDQCHHDSRLTVEMPS
jgi:hypothetical protein